MVVLEQSVLLTDSPLGRWVLQVTQVTWRLHSPNAAGGLGMF